MPASEWKLLRNDLVSNLPDAAWPTDVSVDIPSDQVALDRRADAVDIMVIPYLDDANDFMTTETVTFDMQVGEIFAAPAASAVKGRKAGVTNLVGATVNGSGYKFGEPYRFDLPGGRDSTIAVRISNLSGALATGDTFEIWYSEVL